jgi:hypothetical protein
LNGDSESFDLKTNESAVYWVKTKDIRDEKYTSFFFHISDKFEKKKYSKWVETRWGVNSIIMSDEN